jgi:hypothetical protein
VSIQSSHIGNEMALAAIRCSQAHDAESGRLMSERTDGYVP